MKVTRNKIQSVKKRIPVATRAEWDTFTPFNQGFILYMEAEWPGSELKGLDNPYPEGSDKHKHFCDGQMRAYISVLDTVE